MYHVSRIGFRGKQRYKFSTRVFPFLSMLETLIPCFHHKGKKSEKRLRMRVVNKYHRKSWIENLKPSFTLPRQLRYSGTKLIFNNPEAIWPKIMFYCDYKHQKLQFETKHSYIIHTSLNLKVLAFEISLHNNEQTILNKSCEGFFSL